MYSYHPPPEGVYELNRFSRRGAERCSEPVIPVPACAGVNSGGYPAVTHGIG